MDENKKNLGTGWAFPPSFADKGGYVKTVSGIDDVFESIRIIGATEPGERVMRPDFGCSLLRFGFVEITAETLRDMECTIYRAIGDYEHRGKLENVDISPAEAEGVIEISVTYNIGSGDTPYNMVFPYYINETQKFE